MSKKLQLQVKDVDKGWSWIIALACCFGSLVLAGIFRTSGVLFVAFISTYGVTRKEASWPMVVCIAVLNLTGPFSGMLGQRFGIRPTVIAGAIIATIGLSSCYFTTSLTVITILFGGVFGIGYGFINTLMPVILNAYFLNLRATANGIANSGSCIGSVILPIVFEYLIATYGLSGCFLLTGGIVLHLTIAGALMRPPPWLRSKTATKRYNLAEYKSAPCSKDTTHSGGLDRVTSQNKVYTKIENKECARNSELVCDEAEKAVEACLVDHECHKLPAESNSNVLKKISCFPSRESSNFTESFIAVLTCPMFYITAVTNVIFYFLYHMYVVIIVDYALDRQVLDIDTKNILFAFALSDMFGRLCLGWITDRKFISRSRFVMLCMFLIGIVFFAFPHATGYMSLVIVSSLYGLLLGCTMIVFPILLVDFCGIELHAIAFGCMCFMNGFASFGRPFLIGYFRDNIGSYSSMFYILGILSVIASACWLLETFFAKTRRTSPQVVV